MCSRALRWKSRPRPWWLMQGREHGFSSLALSSQVEREDAHAFYANLGYERIATSSLLRKRL